MRMNQLFLTTLVAASCAMGVSVQAKTFKWSSQGEISTWDIHSQNNALQNGIHAYVYESLVYYNSSTFAVEPMLATAWREVSPTQIRFTLREGVKFHDGSAFTADDAVYSLRRAMAKSSNYTPFVQGVERVEKVDGKTVDVFLAAPNPVLLRQFTELRMMSKAWAEKNRAVEPWDLKGKDENFAHRNAMGTGPFTLESWQPDVRMVFKRNPNWWGTSNSNVTEMVYVPIKSSATRVAALLSGEVDMVLDPPPQDLARMRGNADIKVLEGVENRTIFLGMDQFRDELVGSSVKGKNPLKDQRVRQALYQAIDVNALTRTVMRGLGKPAGTLVSPQVHGWAEAVGKRTPYDLEGAKKLLSQAGYGDGFEVDFACTNNRYINDEAVCQAVTAMWAKLGVKAKLRTLPAVNYFPMIQRNEASIYMLGWGVPTFDALYSLQSLVRSVGKGGDGNYNVGRYSNERMDYIVDRAKSETDAAVRTRLLTEGLQLSNDTYSHIPLYDQVIPWAMKKNVNMVHRADNRVDVRTVKID